MLKKISILMISLDPGLLDSGSSGNVIERHKYYANKLKRLDIIVLAKSKNKKNKLSDNCNVYGFDNSFSSIFKAYNLGKKLFKKYNYNLIDTQDPHITGLIGYLLKIKFKSKLEVHFHGDFWKNKFWIKESLKNRVYNILQKILIKKVDAIRVVNKRIKSKLIESGIKKNIIVTINTAVNEEVFVKDIDSFEIQNKYNNKKILLFVGRLVKAKNLFFLLEVIKKLKEKRDDFILLLIGEGEEKDKLNKFIKENNLSDYVNILEPKSHKELSLYYNVAYLLILLSTNESFGKVIIETGFTNTPTLSSESLGPQDIIKDNINGYLVEINNLDQTLDKLDYLLNNKDLVEQAGKEAKKNFLLKYSQKETYKKVEELWYNIVNNRL